MKITILSVGRVRQSFVLEGEQEYLKRLKAAMPIVLLELGLEAPESLGQEQVQEREGKELLKKLDAFDFVVVLDERGKTPTSRQLCELLQKRMNAGSRSVVFVIGGAFGFSEAVRKRADYVLSLSALTFPHQISRLILIEQLYRTHTMMKGVSYHK
jgi:23S rRNA (pseudouridine1915-N3)-methyltransferase